MRQTCSPALREQLTQALADHQCMLMDYLRSLIGNAADADDLFQELGVVILRKDPADIPLGAVFPAWCRGIARNLAMHYFRSRKRRKEQVWAEFYDLLDQSFEEADADAVDYEEERAALAVCLQRLSAEHAELITRHYVNSESTELIARSLNKQAPALRTTMYRIRKKLQACIQARMGAGA